MAVPENTAGEEFTNGNVKNEHDSSFDENEVMELISNENLAIGGKKRGVTQS